MKPFLLLATRDHEIAADGEYEAVARLGGLAEGQLERLRMEAGPVSSVNLDEYSGLILGGSPFNSSDAEASKSPVQMRVEADLATILDEVVARDFPFLGACYGVGTLGLHQGAIVDGTYGEEVGPVEVSVTTEGRSDPLLEGIPDTFHAYVGHKEAVRELPGHAVVLATSVACPVQMFRIKQNLYATQFHPELDLEGILTRIQIYKHNGYFPPETAQEVSERARSHDVSYAHRVLANFVRRYAV